MHYYDEPIQLLTYQCRDNSGGPRVLPSFAWQNDYGGYGVFTDADPHEKTLIARTDAAISRLLSYRDFTPARHYFALNLLYYAAGYVLLTSQATAVTGRPQLMQVLRCIVPVCRGVFSGLEFRTILGDNCSTAAPAQLRQYGALSSVGRKAANR